MFQHYFRSQRSMVRDPGKVSVRQEFSRVIEGWNLGYPRNQVCWSQESCLSHSFMSQVEVGNTDFLLQFVVFSFLQVKMWPLVKKQSYPNCH